MTSRIGLAALACLALLSACKKAEVDLPPDSSQVRYEPAAPSQDAPAPAAAAGGNAAALKVSIPQIAYTYNYAFELPSAKIGAILDRHIALCDRLGAGRCHVLDMQRATSGATASGSLKLVVEAGIARSFGATLTKAASEAGGTQNDSSIKAEDLSKQIVDTEARLRAKQALAARLMELLQNRKGPVADLVAAERGVADVQEEIDAAQSWLADARGRVAMSTFQIDYRASGPLAEQRGVGETFGASVGTMADFFTQSLRLLMLLVAAILPWAVLFGGIAFTGYAIRKRSRRAKEGE